MISKINHKRISIVASPTYSPILDDVRHSFELKLLELSYDYEANYEELFKLASSNENVSV